MKEKEVMQTCAGTEYYSSIRYVLSLYHLIFCNKSNEDDDNSDDNDDGDNHKKIFNLPYLLSIFLKKNMG